MSNLICHYNDHDIYYDLERIFHIDLSTPLEIIFKSGFPPNDATITETFTTADERKTRLKKILTWADAGGDQFPV